MVRATARGWTAWLACLHALAAAPAPSAAAAAENAGPGGLAGPSLRATLKGAAILSRAPDDPSLAPEQDSATSSWRLRLEADARPAAWVTLAAAYEQRLRVQPAAAGLPAGTGPLPAEAPAAYRIRQLDWAIGQGTGYAWRHEVDRASAALHLPAVEVTAGRQAVGWGRGVIFGAVDLFAPFTPLEADREWRRGVDAVRADVRLSDRWSVDAVAAFGDSIDASAFAARLRGYAGRVDGELVVGWRARDLLAGATTSAAVGDAAVHAEACLFLAPEALPTGGAWGQARLAPKLVLGGSHRLALGLGLVVVAEYHYSGFGVRAPADVIPALAGTDFRARLLRGDMQIVGRHAVALLASLELSNELTTQLLGLVSPSDGSGVIAPAATWTLSDAASIQANLYLPWGAAPEGLVLRSEYGATPLSLFVQVRIDV